MIRKYLFDLIMKAKGESFKNEYKKMKNLSSSQEVSIFQKNELKLLLEHAQKNVPYYYELFKHNDIQDNDGIIDMDKFRKIPILTKDLIRKYGCEIKSNDYFERNHYWNTSGGSTGEPVKFIQDKLFNKWTNVGLNYYYDNILKIDEQSSKKVILWGSERDIFNANIGIRAKASNWLLNTTFLNSFRMTEENLSDYVNKINLCKPEIIRGYAGSLYELCRYTERKKLVVYSPKIVISSAETLRKEMREVIENAFGTKVYDFYGSREVGGMAGECDYGQKHIFMFSNYLEVLDNNNNPVREGEKGRIIVTNLHNYSMPLIRYEIGDTAEIGQSICPCGNPLPGLKRISGRITDHFIKENKTIIHGEYFTHLFYLRDWVKTFQIIQEDYKKIGIYVVLGRELNTSEKAEIENKIKLVMGKDCEIFWEFVEEIDKTKSGKHLYTKSLVSM